jgi:hypothetical protein
MPREARAAATPRSDATPLACICRTMGSTLAAKRSALALFDAAPLRLRQLELVLRPAELLALLLERGECVPGALAYHFQLVLGDGAQNVNCQLVGKGHNSSLSFKHRRKGMPMPPPRQALPPVADADTDDDTPPPGENVAIVRG